MPNLPLAKVPGHVDVQTDDELRANVMDVTVDDVVRNLTEQPPQAQALQEPDPREILFEGTFEEVNRLFLENGGRTGCRSCRRQWTRCRRFWLLRTETRKK